MKKNFNDQKGKNGKKSKNNKSITLEKTKNANDLENSTSGNSEIGRKEKKTEIPPQNGPRKDSPGEILQSDPWIGEGDDLNKQGRNDKDDKKDSENNSRSKREGLLEDPTGKTPADKTTVTDPTIDENTIKDSLF